jgi:hypothetical protein
MNRSMMIVVCAGALSAATFAGGSSQKKCVATTVACNSVQPAVAIVIQPDGSRQTMPCVAVACCDPTKGKGGATVTKVVGENGACQATVCVPAQAATPTLSAVSVAPNTTCQAGASALAPSVSSQASVSSKASCGSTVTRSAAVLQAAQASGQSLTVCEPSVNGASATLTRVNSTPLTVNSSMGQTDLRQLVQNLNALAATSPQSPALAELPLEPMQDPPDADDMDDDDYVDNVDMDDDEDEMADMHELMHLEHLAQLGYVDGSGEWSASLNKSIQEAIAQAQDATHEQMKKANEELARAQKSMRVDFAKALAQSKKADGELARSLYAAERAQAQSARERDRAAAERDRATAERGRAKARAGRNGDLESRVEALERLARDRGYDMDKSSDRSLEERVEQLERALRDGQSPAPTPRALRMTPPKGGIPGGLGGGPGSGPDAGPGAGPGAQNRRELEKRGFELRELDGKNGVYRLSRPGVAAPEPTPPPTPSSPKAMRAPKAPKPPQPAPPSGTFRMDDRRDMERAMTELRAEADRLRAEMSKMREELERLPRNGSMR